MVNEKQTDDHHDSEKDHHQHVGFISPPLAGEDEMTKNNQAGEEEHSNFPKNLLPKILLGNHTNHDNLHHHHHHHHHEEHTDATDVTSTDDFTESTINGHSHHDESAQEVAIHKIEQVAERFANVTKKKSKKALKLLTESPFNIFKEIMDEEEEQSSGEEDLENNVPKTASHSRTQSVESLPKEEIIVENDTTVNQTIPNVLGDHTEQNTESKPLDESTHLVQDAEFTPKNIYNQEDTGKPIKFHTHFCLCSFEETPDFLRNNPFIRNHYRKYFSFKLCLQSIFRLHNETVNIWTHMLPIFGYVGLIFYTIYFMVAEHNTGSFNAQNVLDMIIVIIYLGFAINCFFCSSMYHTLNCHSKKIWGISYRCDVSAISGLIGSSIIPALYFNLYCYVGWQIVYISSIGLFAVVGMIFPCLPFKSPRALKIFGIVRTVLFISMVLSAIIPISHFLLFILPLKQEYTGSFYSDYNQDFMIGIIIVVSLYGIGLVFWLTKFPERAFPGKFDLFFSSHNIWHAFIVAASSLWYYYCLTLYVVKVEKLKLGLSCPSDAF